MTKIRAALVTALLVLLPAPPIHAQAPVTVTFRLTLAGPVGRHDGFSVLYNVGVSDTGTEAVFCGQGLTFGHAAPCIGQGTVYTEAVTAPVGIPIHFNVVKSSLTYQLILPGAITPYTNTTIPATYPPSIVSPMPVTVTFQLTFVVPGQVPSFYFAVAFPYDGQGAATDPSLLDDDQDDLPLCTSDAQYLQALPQQRKYAGPCPSGGTSYATIYLQPQGRIRKISRYVFYAFRKGADGTPIPCAWSSPGEVTITPGTKDVLIPAQVYSSHFGLACKGGPIAGAGLQFD